jgi:hypothetical protein
MKEDIFNTPHALAQAEESKKRARETAAMLKPSDEVWAVVGDIQYLTPESIEILKQRGQSWHDENRLGEPRYSRNDGYQFVIHSNQVAALLGRNIRTAQEILQANRLALGKGKNDYITVKEFCDLNHLPEEETRKALKHIQPDFSIK